MASWGKITPIPPEFNGYGYLFECTKCHGTTTYLGEEKTSTVGLPLREEQRK